MVNFPSFENSEKIANLTGDQTNIKVPSVKSILLSLQGVSFEILRFQMAVVPKLCISDPKLVKPKCV